MNDLFARVHRWSMAITVVVASALGILLIVLGPADDASGRGEPPVGDGEGTVDLVSIGGGGFSSPVNTAFAPGQADNVYVVEQDGLVKLIDGGETQEAPFLDLTRQTNENGEQGLLGVAFHPTEALVYAYYTDRDNGDIVVSEFEHKATDAKERTRREVIRIRHRMAGNHNGGQLRFGPDGFLYMATGDGGSGGDPRENAQDKTSLLGKLLRIDPQAAGRNGYSAPRSNPFVGRKGKDAIYATGLRNPFRFNFDTQTARIMIGDVGQSSFEEISIESAKSVRGANFGWDRYEGFSRYGNPLDNSAKTPSRKKHDKPVLAYGRDDGRSVVGGLVVRDASLANLYGRYLFTDFFTDRLRSFVPTLRKVKGGFKEIGPAVSFISSFTEDPVTREVYLTSLGTGEVLRIEPAP